jgi:hypothetical protein
MPEPKRKWSLKDVVILVISILPLGLLLDYGLGRHGSGRPAVLCASMIVLAVMWRWDLSDQRWFWALVVGIVAVHIPLIWFVPWHAGWIPAAVATPVCFADLYAIMGIFNLGERHFT